MAERDRLRELERALAVATNLQREIQLALPPVDTLDESSSSSGD